MKHRYWLFRRNGIYYLQDVETGHRESLKTNDSREAERLRDARDDAAQNPNLGMALAKAYLSNRDPKITKRIWQDVLDEFCGRGQPQTQARRRRLAASKPLRTLRSRKVLETTAQDFLSVLQSGGVMANSYLRCLQNLALGLGWLPWPVLPSRLWPAIRTKPKRGITAAEYQRILSAEKTMNNAGTTNFYGKLAHHRVMRRVWARRTLIGQTCSSITSGRKLANGLASRSAFGSRNCYANYQRKVFYFQNWLNQRRALGPQNFV